MNLHSVTYTWNVRTGTAAAGRAAWWGWPLVFSSNFHIKKKQRKKTHKKIKTNRPSGVFCPSPSKLSPPAPGTLEGPTGTESEPGLGLLARVGPEGVGWVAPGQWPPQAASPPGEPVGSGVACGRPGCCAGFLLPLISAHTAASFGACPLAHHPPEGQEEGLRRVELTLCLRSGWLECGVWPGPQPP